jgi:hypothetical protein
LHIRVDVRGWTVQGGQVTSPLSLRAYAKRRGCAVESVSKAVKTGRLSASVVRGPRGPAIADPELADREWEANTRPQTGRALEPASSARPAGPAQPDVADAVRKFATEAYTVPDHLPPGIPPLAVSLARKAHAAARAQEARADLAEIDVAERRGRLIDADEARSAMIADYSVVKTQLLALPSLVAQRLPDIAGRVEPVVDAAIREVLEELAADGRAQ